MTRPLRVLCAPDKFRDCCTAEVASRAMAEGAERAGAEPRLLPLADGGEGTLEALAEVFPQRRSAAVRGPAGEHASVEWSLSADGTQALIETARACGLSLLSPEKRNPERIDTRGVGDLIRAALDAGAKEILLALGGSATMDGGCGMARALGVRFYDGIGRELQNLPRDLHRMRSKDLSGLDGRLARTSLRVLCDVNAPLLGAAGARRFALQKGADEAMADRLEGGLARLAGVLEPAPAAVPGDGAAGGLGFGARVFLGALLEGGADAVLDLLEFERRAERADMVLTGEGCFDAQTTQGKLVWRVVERCLAMRKPVIVLAGRVEAGAVPHDIDVRPIAPPGMSAEESLRRGPELLALAACLVCRNAGLSPDG